MPSLAIAAAACGFGAVSVLAKLAYEAGSSPRSLFASRVVVAGLLLSPPALVRLRDRPAARSLIATACAGIAFAAAGFLEFEALSRLPAPVLVTLVFLAPLWVALLSWAAFGDPPSRRCALLFPVAFAGLGFLVGAPRRGSLDLVGVALALCASVLFALVFLLLEEVVRHGRPLEGIACVVALAAAVALAMELGGVASELSHTATAPYALAVGALTATSMALLAVGMERTTAFPAAVITSAEPVAAALLSLAFLGEALTPLQIAGGAAVVGSVLGMSAGASGVR
jgi:drug/metabolite transporter (DMT)-like permease